MIERIASFVVALIGLIAIAVGTAVIAGIWVRIFLDVAGL